MLNILNCTPIAQFAIGLDHKITLWNRACELLSGFAADEMIGTSRQWEPFYPSRRPVLADLIIDNDFENFEKLYKNKRASKSDIIQGAWQATDYFKNMGGRARHVFFLAAPIFDPKGELIGSVETLQDVSRQVKDRQNLKASEERYRVLTEQVADGVAVIQEGKIKFVNQALAIMFGHDSPGSLLGKDILDIISPNYRKGSRELLKAFAKGQFREETTQLKGLRADNDEIWVESGNSIIQWERQPALLCTIRNITASKEQELAIREEAYHLKNENTRLKSRIKDRFGLGKLVGKSRPMQEIYDQILQAAASTANVVIYGESGTGKELVARSIHDMGNRGGREFIAVNCGAIPEELIESEFFGYKKGAFTGANIDKRGYLESADQGTLFLDEVGEIPLNMQVKLLRAIEGGGFTPIGSTETKNPDVRVIAATNRDLADLVQKGRMREDFFYRIHIVPIRIPPLRERKGDLPLLVYHFMQTFYGDDKETIIPEKIFKTMLNHDWPGNVRELQNAIQRYVTFKSIDFLNITQPVSDRPMGVEHPEGPVSLDHTGLRGVLIDVEKKIIAKVLKQNKGNRTHAARALKLERRSLQRKLKRFQIP